MWLECATGPAVLRLGKHDIGTVGRPASTDPPVVFGNHGRHSADIGWRRCAGTFKTDLQRRETRKRPHRRFAR